MGQIEFKTVKTKKEKINFLKFAWQIYDGDPHWVPPLFMDKLDILNEEKNPFYEHASIQLFSAYRGGKMVGRIAAIKNDLHNEVHKENIGFFGFFECINDQEVANALLDKAKDWLKDKGLDIMRGPANPSSNDDWGLLIDGWDDSPRLMMTYNPKYYMDLFDNYGLKKIKDLYAYKISNKEMMKSDKLFRVAEIAKKRSGVTVRQLNKKDFNGELQRFKDVYNQAWAPNWGFIPMTEAEIDHAAANLKMLVDETLVLFMEKDGQTIASALVVPDYNYVFKEMNGRLFPFNFIKMFTKAKKIPWARIITLGIIPQYQKKGLDAVLYSEIVKRAANRNIFYGEASWILEDNEMMKRGADVMNGELYKKYRVYEIEI